VSVERRKGRRKKRGYSMQCSKPLDFLGANPLVLIAFFVQKVEAPHIWQAVLFSSI